MLNEMMSICLQHEIDHLNGILFIDHLPVLKQKMVKKKLTKTRHGKCMNLRKTIFISFNVFFCIIQSFNLASLSQRKLIIIMPL